MRITNENIASVRYVNSIWKVGNILASNPPHEHTILGKYNHVVALKITDIELPATHCNITWFPHIVSAVKPPQQLPLLRDHEHGGRHGVDSNNIAIPGNCKPGHDVDVPDGNLPDKMAVLGEYLHPTPLIPPVTNHELPRVLHDGNLPGIPQLALLLPRDPELVPVGSILLKHLDPVVVGVSNDNLLLQPKTESMWRVKLAFPWSKLTELATDLHRVKRSWLSRGRLVDHAGHIYARPEDRLCQHVARDRADGEPPQLGHQIVYGGDGTCSPTTHVWHSQPQDRREGMVTRGHHGVVTRRVVRAKVGEGACQDG